jgi:hypothetical protein
MPNGEIYTDSLKIETVHSNANNSNNNNLLGSTSGSIVKATYKTTTGMATITLKASFDWYEKGWFSYVRCSYASGSYKGKTNQVTHRKFNTTKSSGYQSIGDAWAEVEYDFYNKNVPATRDKGTFTVYCDDEGQISN